MIRHMVRRPSARVGALLTMLGVASAGTPSLLAARSADRVEVEAPAIPTWSLRVLDGKGNAVDFEKAIRLAKTPRAVTTADLPGDISQLREKLGAWERSGNPKIAERATRLLRWLDIRSARSPSERHDKIRKLPVTITTTPARDGRDGLVKGYVAGGKLRMQWFVPSAALSPSPESIEGGPSSGPAIREDCYENEPEPCATEQEMEDYDIVLAQTQYELELAESENSAAQSEYVSFCNSNPWHEACQQEPGTALAASGPSACGVVESCWYHALYATQWVGMGLVNLGLRLAARAGAAAMGVRLAAAAVSASTAALVGCAFMAGWYVGSLIDCLVFMTTPEPDAGLGMSYRPEPEYYRSRWLTLAPALRP